MNELFRIILTIKKIQHQKIKIKSKQEDLAGKQITIAEQNKTEEELYKKKKKQSTFDIERVFIFAVCCCFYL